MSEDSQGYIATGVSAGYSLQSNNSVNINNSPFLPTYQPTTTTTINTYNLSQNNKRLQLKVFKLLCVYCLFLIILCLPIQIINLLTSDIESKYFNLIYIFLLLYTIIMKYILKLIARKIDEKRAQFIINSINADGGLALEFCVEIFVSAMYWSVYCYSVIFANIGWFELLITKAIHIFSEFFGVYMRASEIYFNVSTRFITNWNHFMQPLTRFITLHCVFCFFWFFCAIFCVCLYFCVGWLYLHFAMFFFGGLFYFVRKECRYAWGHSLCLVVAFAKTS